MSRQPHLQRDARRCLIKIRLPPHPVLAVHFTVVAGVNNDGILRLSGLLKSREQPADFLVKVSNQAVIAGSPSAHQFFGEIDTSEHAPHPLINRMLVLEVSFWQSGHINLVEWIEFPEPLRHDERKVRRDKGDIEGPRLLLPRCIAEIFQRRRFRQVIHLDFFCRAGACLCEALPWARCRWCAVFPIRERVLAFCVQIAGELRAESVELFHAAEVLFPGEDDIVTCVAQQMRPCDFI